LFRAVGVPPPGHVREARRIYEHALQLLAEVTGPEHPALAKALGHYAFLCLDAEDWAAAATALERALPIAERAFGPSHRRVGDLLYPLAITREGQGRLDDATAAVTRAHEIAAADPSDPLTPALLDDVMASVSARQGNAKAALGYAERAIEAKRRLYPAGHPGTAFSLQKRAEALEVAGDLAAARRSLEEALALLGDTEAWEQGEALAQMARVLVKAGEVELGIETYERALSLLAKTYGEGPRLDAPRTGLLHAKAAKLLGRGKPDVRAK
jgi:tetratricopeptide (TPR) repeat protein